MILFIISIFIIFLCFFLLFLFSKQDFVLLRQNISLAEIFDAAIVIFLIAIFSGRIFYILDTFNFQLLHAVKFFYITKFAGLSILGFFIGGAIGIELLFRNKKGLRRISDIFAISFFPLLGLFVFLQTYKNLIFLVVSIVLVLIGFIFFIKSHQKYILKDGSNAIAIVGIICLDVIISQFFLQKHVLFAGLSLSQILSIILLPFLAIGIYITQKSSKT